MARSRPGRHNGLTDVPGLLVGQATLDGDGWLTGTTVVVASGEGAVAGVDVRGGGPGTAETDVLNPVSMDRRANAVVLTGGSAYGLAAAHGVMTPLAARGAGVRIGTERSHVVPIVPAAVVFDLGRGGVFTHYPGPDAGRSAYEAAAEGPVPLGNVGAGTGTVVGGLKGGTGSASILLSSGRTVGALAIVNAVGSAVHPGTGTLYAAAFGLAGEFDRLQPPAQGELRAAAATLTPRRGSPLNTTIGVIATDASLSNAQCTKLAGVGHDGLARAIRPAHSMFDGDTIFGLATGPDGHATPEEFHEILTAAADCFTRAIGHAVLAAASVTTPGGSWPCYADLFPSAYR